MSVRSLGAAARVIVFDGDDTLWFVEPLYDQARLAARAVVEAAGHDGRRWEELERRVDVANVARMGTDPARFPTSCAEAYDEVARTDGAPSRPDVRARVWAAARTVFERTAIPNPHALPVLGALRGEFLLALLTKGDPAVQERRIRDAGVAGALDQIAIVPDKTPVAFRRVLEMLGAAPARGWSVGNSLASDVNPALRIGMSAIWVDAHVWEHERRELEPVPGRVFTASSLLEVAAIVTAAAPRGPSPSRSFVLSNREHGPAEEEIPVTAGGVAAPPPGGPGPPPDEALLAAAEQVQPRAHAPYSGFRVGAAVRTASGNVYAGCNVENASYGLTMCAERAATFTAVAHEGPSCRLVAVAVFTEATSSAPCGACRQVLAELGDPDVTFMADGRYVTVPLHDLLPHRFSLGDGPR